MTRYKEFEKYTIIEDKKNPFSTLYQIDDAYFYIEPLFYTYLENLKMHHADKIPSIIEEMLSIVRRNKKVIFSGMDEEYEDEPVTKAEGFIVITLFDITDKLCIFWDNKSRGSDYGD